MKTIYLVTGANGHLGSAVCAALREKGEEVRALVLPGENTDFIRTLGVSVVFGNVCEKEELEAFFEPEKPARRIVIHCAGIVDITDGNSERMELVNIGGTQNVIDMCKKFNVYRFLYVSSVHAIPVPAKGRVIRETAAFSPETVDGAYAKTKAAATALVLESAKDGVPAIVVHPSGIIGPYLGNGNHLVQMVKSYISGKLPAVVRGGYDFVDVRDCAQGILSAVRFGRVGECYILSGDFYEIKEVMHMLQEIVSGKKLGTVPLWLAKLAVPMLEHHALRRGTKPLFTAYSLSTLNVNSRFSHDKATKELGYTPRELFVTLKDTVQWLVKTGECRLRAAKNTRHTKLRPSPSQG
ncbi:MAG: NAD-dependent epimerase/dehydratase family protein [Clostridiales bacterium]|nr:NAD-dependent epimerase/dehydratase family protein [Clostridiales bacterium]